MHADGHIRDDADLHTGLAGGLLRRVQLIGGDPLKPAVELQRVSGNCSRNCATSSESRLYLRTQLSASSLPFEARPTCRSTGTRWRRIRSRLRIRRGNGRIRPGELVRPAFDLEMTHSACILVRHMASRDPRSARCHSAIRPARAVHPLQPPVFRGQREIFRHGLRTDVAEIDETAGNRQIRRWRQRRHRLRGVHRVDKHEVGAGLLLASTSKGLQILIVSDTPGPLERMEYSWLIHPHRSRSSCRQAVRFSPSADNGCSLRLAANGDLEGCDSLREDRRAGRDTT